MAGGPRHSPLICGRALRGSRVRRLFVHLLGRTDQDGMVWELTIDETTLR